MVLASKRCMACSARVWLLFVVGSVVLRQSNAIILGDGDSCLDYDERCEGWANDGECETNEPFMRRDCAYSCAICTDDWEEEDLTKTEEYNRGSDLGYIQSVKYADGTLPSDIYWMITKARSYMKYVVPEQFGPNMLEWCTNEHEECAYWALLGECKANPGYMLRSCAPVCNSCINITLEES